MYLNVYVLNISIQTSLYTSAFQNAGIGAAYASAIKSVGISLSNCIDSIQFKKTYTSAFESAGIGRMPFLALLTSAGTGPAILFPHSLPSGLKHWEKKHRDRYFDPIPALLGAIPAVLKTLG